MSEHKSCTGCVFYSNDPDEQTAYLGRALGGPACLSYRTALGYPLSVESQNIVAARVGDKCSRHQPDNTKLSAQEIVVLEGNINKSLGQTFKASGSSIASTKVSTCRTCVNHVSEETPVMQIWGFTADACRATGSLLNPAKLRQAASGCNFSCGGTVSNDPLELASNTVSMIQAGLPEWYVVELPIAEIKVTTKVPLDPDPRKYDTDLAVSDDDRKRGIRAWRKLSDEVFAPIFDVTLMTPAEASLVPQLGDDEHPELYVDHMQMERTVFVLWDKLDETPAVWGETGTGKTEFFRYMAWRMQVPFRRISITASTELEDLAGKMMFVGNETKYHPGRITDAWSKKGIVLLDEPNTGPPDVWQFIRPLTDNSKQLVLDQDAGQCIERDQDTYLALAMNPAHDARNGGTALLADADGNRLMHLAFTLPDEPTERALIDARCREDGFHISNEQLNLLMKVAVELRAMADTGALSISWGLRPQIKVARALRWFEPIQAYRMGAADLLEQESRQQVLDVVQGFLPGKRGGSKLPPRPSSTEPTGAAGFRGRF